MWSVSLPLGSYVIVLALELLHWLEFDLTINNTSLSLMACLLVLAGCCVWCMGLESWTDKARTWLALHMCGDSSSGLFHRWENNMIKKKESNGNVCLRSCKWDFGNKLSLIIKWNSTCLSVTLLYLILHYIIFKKNI